MSQDPNAIDAPESDYLFIAPSQLPNAGSGLFSVIDISKDEIIAVFFGEKLSDRQANLRASKGQNNYFISMLDGSILDCEKTKGFAKYANDALGFSGNTFKNNARITIDENQNVCLSATRKIKAGTKLWLRC